ncbi:MAG: heat-inducible transcription repressor HrcA [Chloroflexi bacterium]|nr:heat-inducible transcription repressor HrcA [Chloroflexota bacterium]
MSASMTIDDTQLPELTKRQEEILSLIVRSFTQSPEPISSKYLAENFNLGVSSATIRNEMAVLEDLGYISAPHTSAGRVPTEIGYRYFVKRLLDASDLSAAEQSRITEKFQGQALATDQWMRTTVTTLARASHIAALVTAPIAETHRFKHLELIAIQGRLVLMVLVLHGGSVNQQMLTLAESVPQARLSEVANQINAHFPGLNANEVRMKGIMMGVLEREITDLAADLMEKADNNQTILIYRDGLSEIINSFDNTEGAQQAVRVFEERAFMNTILAEILTPLVNCVQVIIAGEGRWEELKHLSMVLSRYGIPGQMSGAVGVLGPTRIDYGRAISTVRYISNLMSDMMVRLYEEDETPADDSDNPPQTDPPSKLSPLTGDIR